MLRPFIAGAALAAGIASAASASGERHNFGNGAQECLSRMIYHEARGESVAGQRAVAEVIVNRAKSGRFPRTICGVVRQPGQFTRIDKAIREPGAYKTASTVASMALKGQTGGVANGATYFHASSARPGWAGRFHRVARIGRHVFYHPKR